MGSVTAVVDFGSSHTVTVLSVPGRAPRLVTVDGQPWMPSAAFLSRDNQLVVGGDAVRMAATAPARLETSAKSKIDEREVLLGDTVVPIATVVKAVLTRAVRAAAGFAGGPVQHLVLTHPADWGSTRLGVLLSAAQGLAPRVSTTAEPVGAAAWFATRDENELPIGGLLTVVDLGGGTCDVAVVRREEAGIEVVGCAGIADLGGADFDQRIVDHLQATVPGLAARLDGAAPGKASPDQLRELVAFRREVRQAKELLSRHPQVDVELPSVLPDALLTRQELQTLLYGDLDRITAFTYRTIVSSGVEPSDLRAIQLVGGSSRIPLLSQMLGNVLDVPIRLDDQPEAVVALGACAIAVEHSAPSDVATTGLPQAAPAPQAVPAAPPRQRGRGAAVVALVVAVVLLAATVLTGFAMREDPLAGTASESANRFQLPPPEPGNELVFPGNYSQGLTPGQLDQPVRVDDGTTDVDWTVHGVLDPADDVMTAGGAMDVPDKARWVLVDTFIEARKDLVEPYHAKDTYLVDDRGLHIRWIFDQPMPPSCPYENRPTLAQGEQLHQCFAFIVPATTPIRSVVISEEGPRPGDDPIGAIVQVGGAAVNGDPVTPTDLVPLGAVRPMRLGDTTVRAAVVDVVTAPSAYFDQEIIRRPGTRGVMLRAVVESDDAVQLVDLAVLLTLRDDRSAAITMVADSSAHGCTPLNDSDGTERKVRGRNVVCLLYEVPSGMPLASASWLDTENGRQAWSLR